MSALDKTGLEAARTAYQSAIPDGPWYADGGESDVPMQAAISAYLCKHVGYCDGSCQPSSVIDETGIKSCPFCGGQATREELTDEDNFGGSVICCTQCGASSPVHFDRKENLIDSWNRRASTTSAGVTEEQVALDDCPEGLFWFDGTLCFMSEYATVAKDERRQRDAYVVSSGEYFWGGVSTAEKRSKLMVQPITNPEAALEASRVAPVSQKEADDDPACTDCGGTGITYQTERRCACQPSPAPAGEPVGIKALEWVPTHDGDWLRAECVGLVYEIRNDEVADYKKTQCQFDFETRIRSALHPSPTPVSAPVGVVEALRAYHSAYSDLRFAPDESWERADASGRMEDAHDQAKAVLAALRSSAVEGK